MIKFINFLRFYRVEDQEPRFGNLLIKPDHEVEQFRQRIIERVQTVINIIYLSITNYFICYILI